MTYADWNTEKMNENAAPANVSPFPLTDAGNAERFARDHANTLRFCHERGCWLVWDGMRWKPDAAGTPMTSAIATARNMLREAAKSTDSAQREAVARWALNSEKRANLESMIAIAKAQTSLILPAESMDSNPNLLNVRNGTIDLRTGQMHKHRREDYITRLAPVKYDPAATYPVFQRFLDRVFSNDTALITYVQRWFGHCCTAHIGEQFLPIFHGAGSNGKSVLVELIADTLGDYAAKAPLELLVQKRNGEHPTEIADLSGKRFVYVSETEKNSVFRLAFVKSVTGDSKLKGRFMRQDYFEFARTHKTVMLTNTLPAVREDSEAVKRRLIKIPFSVVIPPAERDQHLPAKLAAERSGILNWLIAGAMDWYTDGLGLQPFAVSVASDEYLADQDVIGQFIGEVCETGTDSTGKPLRGRFADLFTAFLGWCRDNHIHPDDMPSKSDFGSALTGKGYHADKQRFGGSTAACRTGIRVRLSDSIPFGN